MRAKLSSGTLPESTQAGRHHQMPEPPHPLRVSFTRTAMKRLLVVGGMVATFAVGLSLNVSTTSYLFGANREFYVGSRIMPNVCADLEIGRRTSFYAGVECDY